MGKDHNCTNYGGADGCSACMNDLRAELLDLKREHVALQDGHLDNMLHLVERTRERDTLLLQVGELQKEVEKLGRAPTWHLHAETCDRKALEAFMERYCLWYNDVKPTEKPVDRPQNCIDCGKPVTSGNICLPCVRVRYPDNSVEKRKDEGREVDVEITSREKGKPRIVED